MSGDTGRIASSGDRAGRASPQAPAGLDHTATIPCADETITDCGPDGGCEECDICRYLNFLEWAQSVGKPDASSISRNEQIEAYLRRTYPYAFASAMSAGTAETGTGSGPQDRQRDGDSRDAQPSSEPSS